MYDRILFPTDGSETAADVFEYATAIAAEHDATIHVLNVADTGRDSVTQIHGEVVDALEEEGEDIVAETVAGAPPDVSMVTDVVQGDPRATIVEYSEQADVDLVVMPTHGRAGLERVLLGSVTEHVINSAPVPVVAVNPTEDHEVVYPPQNVLVPTDGSDGATRALERGIELAKTTGAALHVVTVVETSSLGFDARSVIKESELATNANEIVAEATELTDDAAVDPVTTSITYGRPYREILSYIDANDVDLVCMGTQGQTAFGQYFLGSVANKLVRTSPVPVLTIREEIATE